MKKLTKKRRLEIYKDALSFIQEDIEKNGYYHQGFCWAIYQVIEKDELWPYSDMRKYRELYSHKPPKYVDHHWWLLDDEGDKIRIAVLMSVIEKME